MNGEFGDALVLARNTEGLRFYLTPDLFEVGEALIDMEELGVFGVRFGFGRGGVDELQYERSSRHDALTTGQKISANNAT